MARRSLDRHGFLGEYRGGVKQRSMVLAAIETVANADAIWLTHDRDAEVAA
jgi:hypothetical protein